MAKDDLNLWIGSIEEMGPFRCHPDGTLYVYADPADADPGDPCGIYIPAEEAVKRTLTKIHGTANWSQAKRNEAMAYLKDESAPVFGEIEVPMIPCLNGVLDLSDPLEIGLQEHSSLYGFTAQIPHLYNPFATCPRIEQFLLETFEGSREMVQFVYELLGYSILPTQFLRKAVLLLGPSGTGKSTVLYLLEKLVGQGASSFVSLHQLSDDRFAAADLFGKLVNIGGDLDSTVIKNTGQFKSLTGGDLIRADKKYAKPVSFRSSATMWFAANEAPPSSDHSDAYRGRWVVLPMTFQPKKLDFMLKGKLSTSAEMEGLFRHAVEGAAQLLARGDFRIPAAAAEAHEEFVLRTDQLQAFLHHAEGVFSGDTGRDQLWATYQAWSEAEGGRPVKRSILLQRSAERWGESERGYVIKTSTVNGDVVHSRESLNTLRNDLAKETA